MVAKRIKRTVKEQAAPEQASAETLAAAVLTGVPSAPTTTALVPHEPGKVNPSIGRTVAVDPTTGEVEEGPAYLRDALWAQSGTRLTPEQQHILMRPVTDDEIEIKPDSFGAVYLSHAGYRRRLIDAFGMGGWFLRPLDKPRYDESRSVISWHYALIADGRTVGQAVGEQAYWPEGDMTYGDALEGAKSNALMRCCKDLGVALELWERRTANAFRERLGVKVRLERKGRTTVAWRRVDDAPLWGEVGVMEDSPNRPGTRPTPREAHVATPPTTTPVTLPTEPVLSEQQVAAIRAAMEATGVTPAEVKAFLSAMHNVTVASAKQIPVRLQDAVLKFIASRVSENEAEEEA